MDGHTNDKRYNYVQRMTRFFCYHLCHVTNDNVLSILMLALGKLGMACVNPTSRQKDERVD